MAEIKPVPLFVKRDIDGFFGLFIDNLVQLLVIAELTAITCGFEREFIYGRILPGAAISIVFGNVFYAWQARRIAQAEGRDDVTALPYGINTPSVFAFIFFVMAPAYAINRGELGDAAAADLAWKLGLVACLGSGLIEFFGSFIAERIRRVTPRAALLAPLAGIAIGFISMDFVLQVFEHPLLAMLPMGIILMQYFSGVRLPGGLPAGLVALLVGTAIGWGIKALTIAPVFDSFSSGVQAELLGEVASMPTAELFRENLVPVFAWPRPAVAELVSVFTGEHARTAISYVGVIVPMGLFNLVGSLQNIESAEVAGDRFPTRSSLAANGLGTILAASLGSCFPTTIYIGHVGWKRLGARTGYSLLNGVVIGVLCLTGLIASVSVLVPLESVIGILLWIAIVITAQAFQGVERKHAPAVALGLIPAIAAWGYLMFGHGLASGGGALGPESLATAVPPAHLGGLLAMDRGSILTSMGLAAIGVTMIDRRFDLAAGWAWALAGLAFFGAIHAYNPLDAGQPYSLGFATGWRYAIAYGVFGLMLFALRGRVAADPEGADARLDHQT